MLRRIVSNFYRRLPVVRELQAVVREHQKITASLLHVENYISRVEITSLRITCDLAKRFACSISIYVITLVMEIHYDCSATSHRCAHKTGRTELSMRYFAALGLQPRSSWKWGLGMDVKTTLHFSFLKAGPDFGSMETAVSWELWKTGKTSRRSASSISSLLHPRRTFPRYSSNSVCQRSLTCCHSILTRTPITYGKAFAVLDPELL